MKKTRRWLAVLLAGVMLLAGCGNSGSHDPETSGEGKPESQTAETEKSMGRYLEKEIQLPEEVSSLSDYPRVYMTRLDNGDLEIMEETAGKYISKDNGETWEHCDAPWLPELMAKGYISEIALSPDGAAAAIYDRVDEDYCPEYLYVDPEGNTKEMELQTGESYIYQFWFGRDGALYACDMDGRIFAVDAQSGTLKNLFEIEGLSDYACFTEKYMVLIGTRGITIYDMQEGMVAEEDKVLQDFVKEKLGNMIGADTDSHRLVAAGSDEEDVIYFAFDEGLYRHVIGGTAVEQLADGSINSLGDPQMGLSVMLLLPDNEFAVLYSNAKLYRYVYDPDVPTVPEEQLRVYSLVEDYTIRQAVSLFQKKNPEIYVKYEVGMADESGMTLEDAVKNLNTKLMSGSGPDILVLDGLPADSYKEKGILADINELVGSFEGEEKPFPNLVEACREDGKLYAIPARFRLLMMAGDRASVEGITDLKSLADTVERLRQENPEGSILGLWTEQELLDTLGLSSSGAWLTDTGEIDRENLTEFLKQAKRIYEAEMSGLDPLEVEERRESHEELWSTDMTGKEKYYTNACTGALDIAMKTQKLCIGRVSRVDFDYDMITTLARQEEDFACGAWQGQIQDGFVPVTMTGICAGSMENELAVEFYRFLFGRELQDIDLPGGFPVNVESFDSFRECPRERAGGLALSTPDGDMSFDLEMIWPDEEEFGYIRNMASSASRICTGNSVIEQAVYEIGAKALDGSVSVEEAVEEIIKKAAIYLAE